MLHLHRIHFAILASAASAAIILTIAILASNDTQAGNNPQQAPPHSAFATAASEQVLPSLNNSNQTGLPADYGNLTTFELFEKYPALDNMTRAAYNDNTTVSKAPMANQTASNGLPSFANDTASAATMDSLRQEIEELKAKGNIIAEYIERHNETEPSSPPSHSLIENITETVESLQQAVSTMNRTIDSLDKVANKLDSAASELHTAASNLSNAADSLNASSLSTSLAEDNDSIAQNSPPPINITITANPSANVSLGQHQSPPALDKNGSVANTTTSGMGDNAYQNDNLQLSNSSTTGNDLITSSAKRLTGELEDGDYLIAADLSPYRTMQGSSHLALKVPCNYQGEPKVGLLGGIAPDSLSRIDLGEALGQDNAAVNGDEIQLSDNGDYCLYQTALPAGVSDLFIVNNSGGTLYLNDATYYVALTAKLTD